MKLPARLGLSLRLVLLFVFISFTAVLSAQNGGQYGDEPSNPPAGNLPPFDPSGSQSSGSSVENPDLVIGPCDELNIVVVLDESGSIDDDSFIPGQFSQNEQEVRSALFGLATVLANTGSEMAIIQFSSESEIVDIDGLGPGPASYREVNDDFVNDLSEYLYPGGVNPPANDASGYEAFGFTNWEAAFDDIITLNATELADIVIFMTDGNPTAYVNPDNTNCIDCPVGTSLNEAIAKADQVKLAGSHLYGVTVGESINLSNIIAITGPEEDLLSGDSDGLTPANADYTQASFSDIQDDFSLIATEACEPDIELEKTVYLGHDNGASCPGVELVGDVVGTDITYCFEISNLGNTYMDLVSFTDAQLGIDENTVGLLIASGAFPIPPLDQAPNNKVTLYYETNITVDMVNLATVQVNPVDASGIDLGLADETDSDTAAVEVVGIPCGTCGIVGPEGTLCPGGLATYTSSITGLCDSPVYQWVVSGPASIQTDNGQSIDVLFDQACSAEVSISLDILCDGCANSSITCPPLSLMLQDTINPSVICPSDITIECGASSDPLNTGVAIGNDDCGAVSIDFSDSDEALCGNTKVITRTWVATDNCGNTNTCDQLITIEDSTPPTISCPADMEMDCGASTDPFNTGTASGNDVCGTVSVAHSDEFAADCGESGVISRTWTVTDQCGLTAQCIQTITLIDTIPPQIFCPQNQLVDCGTDTSPAAMGTPQTFEDCGVVSLSHSDSVVSICGNSGLIYRTWVATDACGNSSECEQQIAIVDNEDPVISCPADAQLECGQDTSVTALGSATVQDNCGTAQLSHLDSFDSSCGSTGVLTRTWTAIDQCGNSSICIQTITISDTTPPSITCPADQLVECGNDTSPLSTGSANASDICGGVTINFDDSFSGTCGTTGVITRTWTATDDCGLTNSCQQLITITDSTPPSISCPGDLTLECGSDTSYQSTGNAIASDLCGTVSVTHSDQFVPSCGLTGTISRTFIATDGCGLTNSCTQTITIVDTTPPTIISPSDVEVECGESTDPINTGIASGADDCGLLVLDFTDSLIAGCGESGTIIRMWLITDECGNSVTAGQTISIVDNTPPSIICPADAQLDCGQDTSATALGTASAEDDCGSVQVSHADSFDPSCGNSGLITRTWTAVDQCGNSTTCDQLISISDNTPPTITCPADTTLDCGDDTSPLTTGSASGGDNCGEVMINFFDSDLPMCGNTKFISRTWIATDDCGLTNSCNQMITVQDTIPPSISCPGDLTLECGSDTSYLSTGNAIAMDICGSVSVSHSDLYTPTCGLTGIITRTFVATDDCGLTNSCTQTITLVDTGLPTISCPPNVSVECGDSTEPDETGKASGGDSCGEVVINHLDSMVSECGLSSVIFRTWIVTDECGNSITCQQTITILDSTPPTIQCPNDTLVECGSDTSTSALGMATANDDCGTLTVSSNDIITSTCGAAGEIQRTWMATDVCGNSSTCVQTITIVDTIDPVLLNVPMNDTVYCSDMPIVPPVIAEDACDDSVEVVFEQIQIESDCPEFRRTWIATDDCGNSAVAHQVIYFNDTIAPAIAELEPLIEIPCDASQELFIDVTDDCDTALTIDYFDTEYSGNCGVIERTWVVTDDCGNSDSATQYVILIDEQSPSFIDPPQDVLVECIDDIMPAIDPAVVDNCSDEIVVELEESVDGLDLTRTWTATDQCGNSSTHIQVITSLDNCVNCPEFDHCPEDLTKSFNPVNGVQDRVQLKWYKYAPEIKYTDEDAAACDIIIREKRHLDPQTGNVVGPPITDPEEINLVDVKKYHSDGSPRSIFKWPVMFMKEGANNTRRVKPNMRYEFRIRCACEHGAGQESPWSNAKMFNTPDFDPITGINYNTAAMESGEGGDKSIPNDLTVSLYPNPTTGLVSILTDVDELYYQVLDLNGSEITSGLIQGKNRIIDLEQLSNGLYMIRMTSDQLVTNQVIVIAK